MLQFLHTISLRISTLPSQCSVFTPLSSCCSLQMTTIKLSLFTAFGSFIAFSFGKFYLFLARFYFHFLQTVSLFLDSLRFFRQKAFLFRINSICVCCVCVCVRRTINVYKLFRTNNTAALTYNSVIFRRTRKILLEIPHMWVAHYRARKIKAKQ